MKVRLSNITKSFYGAKALDDIQITLQGGEIHCLVGENGAGKSTLIKILAGHYFPDSGQIFINDVEKRFNSPRDSQNNRIAVMHQELMLVSEMSVAENIVLGKWPTGRVLTDKKEMVDVARKTLQRLGSNIDPNIKVSQLSTGQQQMVEIARALSQNIEVLIMDEPTAALSDVDAKKLLEIVKSLKKQNIAVLYVSHRLEEVFEIADKITVFRDGKYVGSKTREQVTPDGIIKMMVGKNVELGKRRETLQRGKKVLELKNLTGHKFSDVSFELYEGEVLGLAGLVGAGRSEILRAIYGVDRYESGEVFLYGKREKITHPSQAKKKGIAMVPEDRKTQGLVLIHPVIENLTLAILERVNKFGFVNKKQQLGVAKEYRQKLMIKTASLSNPVMSLSGGNQQKVVLARSLVTEPKILLLDEPTRGVDIGAREEIHRIIDQAVKNNMAVLLVSSDLMELIAVSDRLIVLKEGKIKGKFSNNLASKEEVLHLATV